MEKETKRKHYRTRSLFCCKNLSIENKNKSFVSNGLPQLKKLRLKFIYQLSIV